MENKYKTQFIEYFTRGIKKKSNLKIGVEQEKFLFEGKNKKRISYEKLKQLFENLKKNKWEAVFEDNKIIGLKRGKQQITTEPGLQCELSGEPLDTIHKVCSESTSYLNEITEASKGLDISTASIGFDPFNTILEIPKNPKERYRIMSDEMPKGGELSLDMMYRTCGIQINYDYVSEKNFEKIFRIGNYLTPLTISMFANSPFEGRQPNGYLSYRNKVWQKTSRGGIMPIAFENMTFEKYFDHVINYPILFAIRDKKYIKPNGQNFKDFIKGNFTNLKEEANLKDFENHLATIFTEVRLKQYVELRSLDACNWGCICNGPAFFTGLFYGPIDEVFNIITTWKKENVMNAYLEAPKKGLSTELEGRKLYEWGKIFLKLSKNGLVERRYLNDTGKDETIYLKHIEDIIEKKTSRAQLLLNKFETLGDLEFLDDEKEDFSYSGL
jgi:glutamate--cysteine ligase